MKRSVLIIGVSLLLAGLIASAPAMAQEDGEVSDTAAKAPEDTMQVVEPNETPEDVDRKLTLPESASEQGVESSSQGLETANEAREKGREFGRERAEEARESGSERAEEARERARERAEGAKEHTRGENVRDQVRDRDRDQNNRP